MLDASVNSIKGLKDHQYNAVTSKYTCK